jgi:hypothetical protein
MYVHYRITNFKTLLFGPTPQIMNMEGNGGNAVSSYFMNCTWDMAAPLVNTTQNQ